MPSNFRNMIRPLATAGSALQLAIRRDPSEMLTDRHFFLMLLVAFILHLMAVGVWHLMPSAQVVDIPVRALNIKLGDGEPMPDEKALPQPTTGNNAGVENTISRLIREQSPVTQQREKSVVKSMEKAMTPTPAQPSAKKLVPAKGTPKLANPKEKKFDMRSEGVNVAAPVMSVEARQFVRDTNPVVKVGGGSTLGNSNAPNAEIMARYEQHISLWIQKFKLYPEEAKNSEMQGETVVRIRIDRRGNIRYYTLERSTGHTILDRAAIDMIRRANPVPAVPHDYPPGEMLEFLIPVNFQLQ